MNTNIEVAPTDSPAEWPMAGNDTESPSDSKETDPDTVVLRSVGASKGIDGDDGACLECSTPLKVFGVCLAIAIIIACLFIFDIIDNSDLEGVPVLNNIDLDGFFDSDPFNGQVTPETPEAAYRWPTEGFSGLELSLLNALDDSWQSFYETAVSQWENGDPDTLTLSSRRVAYDPTCEQVDGVMKVCNADYGDTQWRGLNVVLLDFREQWIYSSAAKMNEFYLANDSNAQKQYTMCHELGHGFGLPHWDEDFFNRNIGNCMDYTDSPRSNAQPDRNNFNFLATLYGVVGGTAPPPQQGAGGPNGSGQQGSNQGGPSGNNNGNGNRPQNNPGTIGWGRDEDEKEEDEDDRRKMQDELFFLRGYPTSSNKPSLEGRTPATRREVPETVMDNLKGAVSDLDTFTGKQSWTTLTAEEHGEILELDLGDGFVARAFMLKAVM